MRYYWKLCPMPCDVKQTLKVLSISTNKNKKIHLILGAQVNTLLHYKDWMVSLEVTDCHPFAKAVSQLHYNTELYISSTVNKEI